MAESRCQSGLIETSSPEVVMLPETESQPISERWALAPWTARSESRKRRASHEQETRPEKEKPSPGRNQEQRRQTPRMTATRARELDSHASTRTRRGIGTLCRLVRRPSQEVKR